MPAPSSCLTQKLEPWLGAVLWRPHKGDESLSLFKRKKESGQRDFWAEGLWLHVHPREETLEETEDYLALSLGALCSEDRHTSYHCCVTHHFKTQRLKATLTVNRLSRGYGAQGSLVGWLWLKALQALLASGG